MNQAVVDNKEPQTRLFSDDFDLRALLRLGDEGPTSFDVFWRPRCEGRPTARKSGDLDENK
jgi:hypothetical protein